LVYGYIFSLIRACTEFEGLMFRYLSRPVVLALSAAILIQPALGNSIFTNQITPGPVAEAVNAGANALQKGDLGKAEESFQEALKLQPNEPHALVLLAEVAMRRSRPNESLHYLRTAVEKNPNSAVAQEAIGRYLAVEQDPGAEAALQKAIQLDPKWLDARITLGSFYLSKQKTAEAIATYRAALGVDPNNADAHYNLAKAMDATDDKRSAEGELRTAIRLAPKAPRPHLVLGDLLVATERRDEALEEYESATQLDPHSAEPYVRLGMAQQQRGRTDLGEEAYRKAIEIQPNHAVALNNLAWIQMQNPRHVDEALSLAKKAVDVTAGAGQFLDTLGWVYRAMGLREQAIVTLKKGISASPQDAELHYHLALLYQEAGKSADALTELNGSLSLKKDFPERDDARKRLEELKVHSQPSASRGKSHS
jgi:tetratricopeptide (TPR) repeat protein